MNNPRKKTKNSIAATAVSGDQPKNMVMVSFRCNPEIISDLKRIAKHKGAAYQSLLRRALTDYVDNNPTP